MSAQPVTEEKTAAHGRNAPALSIRWQKALRDLTASKTRTALVVLSIAVGVFAFGVIVGARVTVGRELRSSYLAVNPASAILHTAPVDEEFVESVAEMPQVAAAEGRRLIPARVLVGPDEWNNLRIFAVADFDTIDVNIVRPESGAWPPPEREILIERNSLFLVDAGVGDTLTIELPDGRQRALRIAGLAHDMNQPPAQIFGDAFGYVSEETLAWLGVPAGFNELQIRVTGDTRDKAHIARVAAAVEDKVERSGRRVTWTELPNEPDAHPAEAFLDTILVVLGALGVLSLLLSGFLIINTINAMMVQHTRQIGVMKAIGARAADIMGIYLRLVFIFGLLALVLAVPLSGVGALALARFVAGQLNFDIVAFQFSPGVLAAEIGAGLLVPLLAAFYPVAAAGRITIREAIASTGLGDDSHAPWPVAWLLGRLPLSRPLRLSLRNTFRRKGRLVFTLITLALGGALFISILTVRASLFATLEATLSDQTADVQVSFETPHRRELLERELGQIPGVTAVESVFHSQGVPLDKRGIEAETVIIEALPPETDLFEPNIGAGRWLRPGDENAIVLHSNLIGKEPQLELGLGKTMTLQIGDEEIDWHIVGVNRNLRPPIGPSVVYVNRDYFARVIGQVGRANSVRVVTARHDAQAHAAVSRAIEERLAALDLQPSAIKTATDDRNVITERFNILTTLLMIMSFLVALVGGLGLMGTMSINVIERRREIGVMRAIGASDRVVLRIFIVEGVLIGLLSWLGAMVLNQPISRAMSYQVGVNLIQLPLVYTFSYLGAGLWLFLVALLAAVASYWPARKAADLRIREILAYE